MYTEVFRCGLLGQEGFRCFRRSLCQYSRWLYDRRFRMYSNRHGFWRGTIDPLNANDPFSVCTDIVMALQ